LECLGLSHGFLHCDFGFVLGLFEVSDDLFLRWELVGDLHVGHIGHFLLLDEGCWGSFLDLIGDIFHGGFSFGGGLFLGGFSFGFGFRNLGLESGLELLHNLL